MKTTKIFTIIILITNVLTAQLKVRNNGYVAIGINWPNHSLHVLGYSQIFNYNSKEILFRPFDQSGSRFHSTIGSNLGEIIFWHPAWGYNTLTRGTCRSLSDQRLKNEITILQNSLETIKKLDPKKFRFADSIVPGGKYNYGFIAQSVAQIIPELVDTSNQGMLTLNYEGIIPFLVGAVKEQSIMIDSLKNSLQNSASSKKQDNNHETDSLRKEIDDLKKHVDYIQNNCCKSENSTSNIELNSTNTSLNINNDLLNTTDYILLQNVPNPFDNNTLIKFNIPDQYNGKFYLKIYSINGEEKMSFSLDKKDKQITIGSSNLNSGIYLYALIANNDVLSIKQMVISK